MSELFEKTVDKFNNTHVTLMRNIMNPADITDLKDILSYVSGSLFFNIPNRLNETMSNIAQCFPSDFPINPIRDDQKQMIRFIRGPSTIPTGGNFDVGATAIVYDPNHEKVLTVTNARNGRMQYPGGRVDVSDPDLPSAAKRECGEEAGINLPNDIIGKMIGIQQFPKNQFAKGLNFVFLFSVPYISEAVLPKCDGTETSSAQWTSISDVTEVLPPITPSQVDDSKPTWNLTNIKSWYGYWN